MSSPSNQKSRQRAKHRLTKVSTILHNRPSSRLQAILDMLFLLVPIPNARQMRPTNRTFGKFAHIRRSRVARTRRSETGRRREERAGGEDRGASDALREGQRGVARIASAVLEREDLQPGVVLDAGPGLVDHFVRVEMIRVCRARVADDLTAAARGWEEEDQDARREPRAARGSPTAVMLAQEEREFAMTAPTVVRRLVRLPRSRCSRLNGPRVDFGRVTVAVNLRRLVRRDAEVGRLGELGSEVGVLRRRRSDDGLRGVVGSAASADGAR
jgi:hypothetical protein